MWLIWSNWLPSSLMAWNNIYTSKTMWTSLRYPNDNLGHNKLLTIVHFIRIFQNRLNITPFFWNWLESAPHVKQSSICCVTVVKKRRPRNWWSSILRVDQCLWPLAYILRLSSAWLQRRTYLIVITWWRSFGANASWSITWKTLTMRPIDSRTYSNNWISQSK